MIEFAVAAFGASLMAFEDIRSKGYSTHDWIAKLMFMAGLVFTMFQPFALIKLVLLCSVLIIGFAISKHGHWGESDVWLMAGCCAIFPLGAAIAFPVVLFAMMIFYSLSHVLRMKLNHKRVNMKERIPMLPAFALAIIFLWGLIG